MSGGTLDRLADARIREAASRGELDALPGAGKPLPPDDLSGLSHDERVEALLARSTGGIPEEVILLREIDALRGALAGATEATERARLSREISDKSIQLSLLFERSGRFLSAAGALRFMP